MEKNKKEKYIRKSKRCNNASTSCNNNSTINISSNNLKLSSRRKWNNKKEQNLQKIK